MNKVLTMIAKQKSCVIDMNNNSKNAFVKIFKKLTHALSIIFLGLCYGILYLFLSSFGGK